MKRRSESKRCLLCLVPCSTFEKGEGEEHQIYVKEENLNERLVMAGATNCQSLQKQLEHIFILRKLLDVPESFCMETLFEKGLEVEIDNCNVVDNCSGGNPGGWFEVCSLCMGTQVTEAWKTYQQMSALEVKMLEIRKRVKERMKEEMLRSPNRSWIWSEVQQENQCRLNEGVEEKIRKFIFPDLEMTSLQMKIQMEKDEALVDDLEFENISNFSEESDAMSHTSDPLWDSSGASGSAQLQNSRKKSGRGRGRRQKHQKNRRNPPLRLRKRKPTQTDQEESVKLKKWNWFCCHELDCRAKYTSSEELTSHQRLHEERKEGPKGPLDCTRCSFPACNLEELELHVQNRHNKKIRVFHYRCPKCDFQIENDFPSFKDHFDKKHPSPHLEESNNDDQLQTSSAELPLDCPLCNRRCENLRYFSVHMRKTHPEHLGIQVGLMECDQCGMKFTTQHELSTHINCEHKRPSKYVCDQCGKGYQFLSRLESHKIKHVSKTKRDFVCHLCGLDYAHKFVLEKHYRKCHPSTSKGEVGDGDTTGDTGDPLNTGTGAEQIFTCKYCEFTSSLKGIMMRHLQQHKQIQCDQCNKSYVNEAGLKRHLRINHPLVKQDVPCPFCLKTFVSVEYMKDHMTKFCKMKKLSLQNPPMSTSDAVTAAPTQQKGYIDTKQTQNCVIDTSVGEEHDIYAQPQHQLTIEDPDKVVLKFE